VLGVSFGIAVTIGNTIGAGILRTPGEVAGHLPNTALFLAVWFIGGLYALTCSLSVAELASTIPRSGGHYVYARYTFGEFIGFFVGWCDWLGNAGSCALISLVIGEYAGLLFPVLAGHEALIACTVVLAFSLLQWRGVQWGSVTQQISSAAKAVLFIGLAIAFFFAPAQNTGSVHAASLASGFALLTGIVLAVQSTVYTYDGWQGIIYFGEEVHDPGRDIPRSMFGGVAIVIGIYALLNLSLLHVLSVTGIAGDKLPVATAARALWGAHADSIVQAVTIIAMFSAINAIQLMVTRVLYAMSADDLFARMGAHVNAGGTPDVALLFGALVEVLFIISGTVQQVIAAMALYFVTNYIVDFLCVLVLRRREPDRPRPYRTWGYPWTTIVALVASVAFVIGVVVADTRNSLLSLIVLGVSYPLFWLVKRRRKSEPAQPR
jgi:APA family basic amino acid/polyamine antiporter